MVGGRQKQVTAAYDRQLSPTRVCMAVTAHVPGTLFPSDVRIRLAASIACGLGARLSSRTLQLVTFSRRVEPLVCTPLPVWRLGYCAEES